MGRPNEALASFERGRGILERLSNDNPSVTAFRSELAKCENSVGLLEREMGRPDEALVSLTKARAIWEQLSRENPTVVDYQNGLAASYHNIAVLHELSRPEEALASYRQALAICERMSRENPSDTALLSDLAENHSNVGLLLFRAAGRAADALKAYEQALRIRRRLAKENPSVTEFQRNVARSYNGIGVLHQETGHAAEALASYTQALAIHERLAREHPDSLDFASDMGAAFNNFAVIHLNAHQFEKARDELTRAAEWQRTALGGSPGHPIYRRYLINHLRNQALVAEELGSTELAGQARRDLAELASRDPAMAAVDARLAAVIKGQKAKDDNERIELARRAYDTALYAASARLLQDALEANPKLGNDRRAQHRYNAACAAALAGCGIGKDTPPPDEAAKADLRKQALEWLTAELEAWSKLVESGQPQARPFAAQNLEHWKKDSDLAGIRAEKELARLPEAERSRLKQLWADVDSLLRKASAGKLNAGPNSGSGGF